MRPQSQRAALQKRILNKKVALGQALGLGMHIVEARLLFSAGPIITFPTMARYDMLMALEMLNADEREMVAKYLSKGLGFFVGNNAAEMFNVVTASAQAATPQVPWLSAAAARVVVTELALNAIMSALYSETEEGNGSYLPDRTFEAEGEDFEKDDEDLWEVMSLENAIKSGYVYTVSVQQNMKQHVSTWDGSPVRGSTVRVQRRSGEITASSIIH